MSERRAEPTEPQDGVGFRALFRRSPLGTILSSSTGVFVDVNEAAAHFFGYERRDMIGRTSAALGLLERDERQRVFDALKAKGSIDVATLRLRVRTGEHREARVFIHPVDLDGAAHFLTTFLDVTGQYGGAAVSASPIRDPERRLASIPELVRDVTDDRQGAFERQQFFELSLDLLCTAGADGYFRRVNPAFRNTLGYELDELLSRPLLSFVHPDDVGATAAELKRGTPTTRFENRVRCKDGSYKWLSWRSAPDARGTRFAVARDITAEKEAALAMLDSLREKEVLLQELHHRVKNNLQMITSLVNMQLRRLAGGPGREALEDCRRRIAAVALIHEELYRSRDYTQVPLSAYIGGLAGHVFEAIGVSRERVALVLDIQPVSVRIDKAIPCGLIVNEVITNALKHAFPGERSGTVRLALRSDRGTGRLSVSDDGIGLADANSRSSTTLGLELISTLAQQLKGQLDVTCGPGHRGTVFELTFALER